MPFRAFYTKADLDRYATRRRKHRPPTSAEWGLAPKLQMSIFSADLDRATDLDPEALGTSGNTFG
jgi:hypothetical protein